LAPLPCATNACTPPPGRAGQCVPQVCHAPSCGGGQQGLPRPVLLRCVLALEPGAAGSWETMGWVGCTQGQQHACRAAQQGCPWHTRFLCMPASLAGFMSKNRITMGIPTEQSPCAGRCILLPVAHSCVQEGGRCAPGATTPCIRMIVLLMAADAAAAAALHIRLDRFAQLSVVPWGRHKAVRGKGSRTRVQTPPTRKLNYPIGPAN